MTSFDDYNFSAPLSQGEKFAMWKHDNIQNCIQLKHKYGSYAFHDFISQWEIDDTGEDFHKLLNWYVFDLGCDANELNDKGETPFTIWIHRYLDYLRDREIVEGITNRWTQTGFRPHGGYVFFFRMQIVKWVSLWGAKFNVQNPDTGNTIFHDLIRQHRTYIETTGYDETDSIHEHEMNTFRKIITLLSANDEYSSILYTPNYEGDTLFQWIVENLNEKHYPIIWDNIIEHFI